MTDAKVERYKRVRGALLKVLANYYPGVVDSKVLEALATDLGFEMRDRECDGHIAYLAEKGFASLTKRKAEGIEIHIVKITAKGLDLLDGIVEDPGVDVRF